MAGLDRPASPLSLESSTLAWLACSALVSSTKSTEKHCQPNESCETHGSLTSWWHGHPRLVVCKSSRPGCRTKRPRDRAPNALSVRLLTPATSWVLVVTCGPISEYAMIRVAAGAYTWYAVPCMLRRTWRGRNAMKQNGLFEAGKAVLWSLRDILLFRSLSRARGPVLSSWVLRLCRSSHSRCRSVAMESVSLLHRLAFYVVHRWSMTWKGREPFVFKLPELHIIYLATIERLPPSTSRQFRISPRCLMQSHPSPSRLQEKSCS